MKKTLSGRNGYSKENGTQECKEKTIKLSNPKEAEICGILGDTNLFPKIEVYTPKDLLPGGTPAVKVNTGKKEELVCAPDIRCFINENDFFWVDVKDKPQRYYHPDTGCDIHQYMSYYKINRFKNEPVLLFFKDPSWDTLLEGMKKFAFGGRLERLIDGFKPRWGKFAPEEKPFWYGNWFNVLCTYDEELKYPICRPEHTRDMPMDICYMHVSKMVSYANNETLTTLLKDFENQKDTPDFKIRHTSFGIIEDISWMDERIKKIFEN